ncbi:MAG: PAS domain S-box protein, partial [Bacteroidota bacterium]
MKSQDPDSLTFLNGGGEMGELTRQFNWAQTPLGVPSTWPQSLRLTLAMILSSKFPMFLWWGDDLIQFYNDAYRPSLGNNGKHPLALGQKGKDCWPEIWDIIQPLINQVLTTKESTWSEDQLIPIYRNGRIEDVYWTFGYSPILGETGQVEGVLVVCTETTSKIKTMNALAESEERFRNMAENTDILVAMSDETSNATYFNKAWEEFTGRSVNDLKYFGWADLIHEEDKQPFLDIYLNAFAKKQPWVGEFRMLNKKGEYRWLMAKGPVRQAADGVFAGYISSSIDITERKNIEQLIQESEQQVRSIIDAAPFPIGVYTGE